MSLEALRTFFGWYTVVNLAMYALTVFFVAVFPKFVWRTNAKLFGLPEEQIAREAFGYVGRYKLAIILFCFTPYVALMLMM